MGVSLAALVAGCTGVPQDLVTAYADDRAATIDVCHGFGCPYQTPLRLGPTEHAAFAVIMAPGRASAREERSALSGAVQLFEEKSAAAIGGRDLAKNEVNASTGRASMDCIDESANTRNFMQYLSKRGLLTHHKVSGVVLRGFFADGRYPHHTAVLVDDTGRKWAVDSWFEDAGGPPDIMPLSEWRRRGVLGER